MARGGVLGNRSGASEQLTECSARRPSDQRRPADRRIPEFVRTNHDQDASPTFHSGTNSIAPAPHPGAVARHRATGEPALLDVATRFADYLAPHSGRDGWKGYAATRNRDRIGRAVPETEMPTTCSWPSISVDARGHRCCAPTIAIPATPGSVPLREATTVEGHAVRALYLAAGVTDVLAGVRRPARCCRGPPAVATHGPHQDLLTVGSAPLGGRGIRRSVRASPDVAYCETCAAIASVNGAGGCCSPPPSAVRPT